MSLYFQYEQDYGRLIRAVNCDSTAVIPAIRNVTGAVIEAYNQAIIAQVVTGVLVYKVEDESGVLWGMVGIQTAINPAGIIFQQFRPAFQAFLDQISSELGIFVSSGNWQFDQLQ